MLPRSQHATTDHLTLLYTVARRLLCLTPRTSPISFNRCFSPAGCWSCSLSWPPYRISRLGWAWSCRRGWARCSRSPSIYYSPLCPAWAVAASRWLSPWWSSSLRPTSAQTRWVLVFVGFAVGAEGVNLCGCLTMWRLLLKREAVYSLWMLNACVVAAGVMECCGQCWWLSLHSSSSLRATPAPTRSVLG